MRRPRAPPRAGSAATMPVVAVAPGRAAVVGEPDADGRDARARALSVARPRRDRVQAEPAAARAASPAASGAPRAPRLSSQVAPPSRLSNSTPGSPPAYSRPSSSPGTITQIRSSAASPPSGSATPLACSHSPAGIVGDADLRPVERRRHGREDAAACAGRASRTRPARRRTRARSPRTAAPGSPSSTNRPFLVPTSSSVIASSS